MRRFMAIALLSVMIMLGTVGTATPAQAHFEQGGNCRFENISARGVIAIRFTNRTHNWARVTCVLNFDVGRNGYMYRDVAPRSWAIGRHRFYGQWTEVTITHVHLRYY